MKSVKRLLKTVAEGVVATIAPIAWRMRSSPRLLVMMYHRVLPAEHPDALVEQPGMYVSPATLDMHLAYLKKEFELVHLDDWVRRAARGEALPRRACAITFDDGWRDNFDHALPVLRRHAAPATIFLVSTFIGTGKEFWPNRLTRILASSSLDLVLPAALAAAIAPAVASARANGRWSRENIDQAIGLAKHLGEEEIVAQLDAIPGAGAEPRRDVLNREEIREMTSDDLVRFGSHTRTHFRLRGEVAPEVLRDEVVLSAAEIADTTGRAADLFCYPNGDFTTAAVDAVRGRYIAAVTTRRGWHSPSADPFLIRRIGVHEDLARHRRGFIARVSGWL